MLFPDPDSPTRPKSLAGMNVERDIVHGANFALGARAEHRLAERENFRQIANFNERLGHDWVGEHLEPQDVAATSSANGSRSRDESGVHRRWFARNQLAQHKLQNAAVGVVLRFLRRVDAHQRIELLGLPRCGADFHLPARRRTSGPGR